LKEPPFFLYDGVMDKLNHTQKILLFVLIISIFLGIPIYDQLGLTHVNEWLYTEHNGSTRFWTDFFDFNKTGVYWLVNIILLFGIYLFKDKK